MKILFCFGTRPEAIKMAPLYHTLKNHFEVIVCVTGQHRHMLDQVLEFFEITPHHDLNLMQDGQTLNDLSALIITRFDAVLKKENPDLVLVHGDTTTSSMAALSAFHVGVRVGHVEAGLRTYDKTAPFPEEINRQLTGRIADFHFAPTLLAKHNLLGEHVPADRIVVTGNTVVDALHWAKQKIQAGYNHPVIRALQAFAGKKIVLVTGHRRENFGDGFAAVCAALKNIAQRKDVLIVFPVHLNPMVRKPVDDLLAGVGNIHLMEPVEYPVMIWLLENCSLIISDSGGIQEEAPAFMKPILVTRDVSERPEGVDSGYATLVGTNAERIVSMAAQFLDTPFENRNANPYGDGQASQRISDFIKAHCH
ncbi:UDP-N-acetylglucosamine 2-epimerase (non-hydrolyzing) [Flavobacterium magnum]|uniref:UDP-N-acetylglucosamine 2-epimerase (non-hydrolyzing) n=1 Tax=Flavobacterium magnum TaxID=2162713 RepID=A0A2S0RL21_9FLAO|nr:UDP-N-acetylglucosamine 2-epimerase (non-hydrolyzing) [Flavobacterium magnum]